MSQCLVCSNSENNKGTLSKLDTSSHAELELVSCSKCGHVFLKDIVSKFDAKQYKYYRKYRGLEERKVYNELTRRRHLADLARFRRMTPIDRVLDVGCGKGDFVWAVKDEKLDCLGIDLAHEAIAVGQSFDLNVKEADFFSSEFKPGSFDLITMYELIEHVPNPKAFVERAAQLLRPGGIFFITTPNYSALDRLVLNERWSVIHAEHLSYFTPSSMRFMIRQSKGFRCVNCRTVNMSLELLNALMQTLRKSKIIGKEAGSSERTVITQGGDEGSNGLREDIEQSLVLRSMKAILNSGLRVSRLGSSMKVVCRKLDTI